MKKLFDFLSDNLGVVEFVVGTILGALIIVVEVCTPPVTVATIVLGGLIAFVGIIGILTSIKSGK